MFYGCFYIFIFHTMFEKRIEKKAVTEWKIEKKTNTCILFSLLSLQSNDLQNYQTTMVVAYTYPV